MQGRPFSLHVTQPSSDLRHSPEVEPSPAFLSTSDLPAPTTQRSIRQSPSSPSSSSSSSPFWSKLVGGVVDYTFLGGPVDATLAVLPRCLRLCVARSAFDALAAGSRARALTVDSTFRQLDLPGEQPSLGWRTAAMEEWWAAGSERSPWDFDASLGGGTMPDGGWRGRGEGGKVRVLFLLGFYDWVERMNLHNSELVAAALAHPHVETDVWGPNWAGWDNDKTVSQNLQARRVWKDVVGVNGTLTGERELKRAGPGHFDLVWTISDIFKMDSPALDNPGHGTLFAQQLGDCHSDDCIHKWYAPHLNITVVKYPHEMQDMLSYERIQRHFPGMKMHLFGHSPDSANRWDFYPPSRWEDKTVDMQGFGYDGSFYPIRTTVTNSLKGYGKAGTDIKWFKHPGYSVSKPDNVKAPEFYPVDSPLQKTHRKLLDEFAGAMRNTKICVFDSSLERKRIRKWAQALLSGCVIAGDIPTDEEESLREFMIELKQDWSIETINAVLKAALDDQEGLQRKAMLGFAYARTHLTNERKVEGMLRLWDGYKNEGWRGYDFPTAHSLRCRQYWSGDSAFRPAWCGPGLMGLEGEWDRAHEPIGS